MDFEVLSLRLRRLFRAFASSLGITAGTIATALPVATSAQTSDYQPTKTAPASWRKFAEQLQSRFRERLSTDDGSVRQLNRLLEARMAVDDKPLNVMTKVWISPGGAIERLEFDLLDLEVAASLRGALIGSSLQTVPPQNMLQPVHLMLSLGKAN